jgi:hypothetical protein
MTDTLYQTGDFFKSVDRQTDRYNFNRQATLAFALLTENIKKMKRQAD